MREQLLVQKVGNRSGVSGKGRSSGAQHPARRGRESGESLASRLKRLAIYLPMVFKVTVAIAIGVLAFLGYRAAASASFFQVRRIETRGVSRASKEAIETTVRRDVSETGVWRADLRELSTHLERLPWVRRAVVTRVLPDGIRIRITEREQKAVVRSAGGRFFWVDDDAVTLGEMLSMDQMPTFFLRGWNEDDSATAQEENRERVKVFLDLQRAWDSQGLSERVSEVNLLDVRDVRAQLAGDDSQIEIRLGTEDFGRRLRQALDLLDKERHTPRGPFISYIDLTQSKRAIVGLISGSRAVSDSQDSETAGDGNGLTTSSRNGASKPGSDKPKEKDLKAAQSKKTSQKRT